MKQNLYESSRLLSEYLQFHYLNPTELFPYSGLIKISQNFPVLCADFCKRYSKKAKNLRALDLGCGTGRSAFELTKFCHEVIAIDYSRNFIRAAKQIQKKGRILVKQKVEADNSQDVVIRRPTAVRQNQIQFFQGDAHRLPKTIGEFDLVLMANLIDRLREPKKCLKQLPSLLRKDGFVVITSPYTWLEQYTPKKNWIGGKNKISTLQGLKQILGNNFKLVKTVNLPFLIREHQRKFQLGVAEASVWKKK